MALEATGGTFGGIEPISRFHEVFQGNCRTLRMPLPLVGLETEVVLGKGP